MGYCYGGYFEKSVEVYLFPNLSSTTFQFKFAKNASTYFFFSEVG